MDPNVLPRALVMKYDRGEVIFAAGHPPVLNEYSFTGCGLQVSGKSPDFLADPDFRRAYQTGWSRMGKTAAHIDDPRWIVHVAIWAASQAARLEGDFVECGVNTGLLSLAICEWLDFNRQDRDFWLFDTYAGIPEAQMTEGERRGIGGWHNIHSYEDCHHHALESFAPWPRCRVIQGIVPDSLANFPADRRVAYLSIDMNIVAPEIAALDFFWDRLVPGAMVLLDDYAWKSHRPQKDAFDAFAATQGRMIMTLPTGQGLLMR